MTILMLSKCVRIITKRIFNIWHFTSKKYGLQAACGLSPAEHSAAAFGCLKSKAAQKQSGSARAIPISGIGLRTGYELYARGKAPVYDDVIL